VADPHDDDTSPWPPRPPADPSAPPPVTPSPEAATISGTPGPEPSSSTPDAPAAPPATTGWIPPDAAAGATTPKRTGGWDGSRIAGVILILVGVFLLLRRFVPLDSQLLLPMVAIVVGGALVLGALRPRGRNG
jgi:uncharacterized membrane protein